ncbi:hypothetical protein POV27_05415 [Aureisphaera galaxeae]|uniref:tetratricopeptide repeat protein n=1 Tax=Aureisphaera galaxeae TaxID=1538023 RepID=UPI0023500506|nr:tetratricopeptide repeat protein [Aureisphaera galaxeae]MDC8003479.1 hypothetical protein [Aureisphaera galaxeae]
MATYKKRGYKPKTKAEKEVEIEDGSATAEVFKTLDEGASKTEAWVEKNQKYIIGFVGIVALSILGFLAYQNFIQEPKQAEATSEMFQAQSHYAAALNATTQKDSLYNLALMGSAGKYGLVDIADKYSGTAAGNIAKYYAGMAYLNLNNYQEAINYLDDYKGKDEATGPLAKGAIGDAFVQLNQPDQALKYYVDAATMKTNDVTSPRFYLKAGITALQLGQSVKALEYFNIIAEDYKDSEEAEKAKLYKGQAEAMQ